MRSVPVSVLLGVLAGCHLIAGCSGETRTIERVEDLFEADEARVTQDIRADFAMPEVEVEHLAPEMVPFEAGELADLGPEPGGFGYPCQTGGTCNSGICMTTPDGGMCTIPCEGECPAGWSCALHKPSLPDEVYVCAPLHMNLCKPCRKDGDCETNGVDLGDRCIPSGAAGVGDGEDQPEGALGSFCGGTCLADADCPEGYVCIPVDQGGDAQPKQCVRKSGECPCAAWFASENAGTSCFAENEWGRCDGERTCTDDGLTPCDAAVPSAESCNGVDDDCDGGVDEDTGGETCTVVNEWGSCEGTAECQAAKMVCLAKEPEPEACDGKDNDCDGTADEEYPDTDEDGLADCLETDKDSDGIPDILDNCELVVNPEQEDHDLDSMGDACDLDDDDDKVADEKDCDPLDPTVYPGAPEQCDGDDEDCDLLVDEGYPDLDADKLADCADTDDDGDGAPDGDDCAPLDPSVHPLAIELCDAVDQDCDGQKDEGFPDSDEDGQANCVDDDLDGDGVSNTDDNCPAEHNPGQENLDKDMLGDSCDDDVDGDGIPNGLDNCLWTFNPAQSDIDQDGLGDACEGDKDGDGLGDGDDNCPAVPNPLQENLDQDGLGDACDDDVDGDGDPNKTDCESEDPAIHHGAQDVCDGIDNDCDSLVDKGYPDFDLDGLKDCMDPDDDGDGALDGADCEPLNPAVHPDAEEKCNGFDEDCDQAVDEGLGKATCGKGQCLHTVDLCKDGKPQFCNPYEGATPEKCDGLDNDCNGQTDEGFPDTDQDKVPDCMDPDDDGDTVPDKMDNCPLAANGAQDDLDEDGLGDACDDDDDGDLDPDITDCAPADGTVFHKAVEACNGKDDDCDGAVDEAGATECAIFFLDLDEDGYGVAGSTQCLCSGAFPYSAELSGDCAPLDAMVFPGAMEACNGKDDDCDDTVDDGYGTVECGQGVCFHKVEVCKDGKMQLCDPMLGAGDEVCDGKDNDCDGSTDEGSLGQITCGLGVCEHSIPECTDGVPGVCDPFEGKGVEGCDGLDNDCDGSTDEEGATGCKDYWVDDDADQYGGGAPLCLCAPGGGYVVLLGGDCADDDPTRNPGQEDVCNNGKDDDCNGTPNDTTLYEDCQAARAGCNGLVSGQYNIKLGNGTTSVYCEMGYSDGGWTQMTQAWLDALQPGTYEYLYVANGAWYRSPATTQKWSWTAYTPVNGTYAYGKGTGQTGTFGCTHGEQGYWGVGCSNCPGGCWKCFVHGAGLKDMVKGQTTICQDQPNVFGYGACGQPVQMYVRKK